MPSPKLLAVLPLLALLGAAAAPAEPVAVSPGLQPQLSAAPNGDLYLVLGQKNRVFLSRSADGGATWSPARAVADVANLPLGMRRGPRVAATDSTIVITAIEAPKGGGKDGDLFAWVSTDRGATWTKSPEPLNSVPAAAREGLHNLASDGKGTLAVVWLDLRNKGTQIWLATSTDGGRTWSPDRPAYVNPKGSTCQCCHPSVAFGPDGTLYVMFRNEVDAHRDLYLTASRDLGKTFTPAEKLGKDSWWLPACPMDGGSLTVGPAGPVTVWRRSSTLYLATPGAEEKPLAKGNQPTAATTPAGTTLLFQAGQKLMLLRPNSKDPELLDPKGQFPTLATTPTGTIVAAWESDGQVKAAVVGTAK